MNEKNLNLILFEGDLNPNSQRSFICIWKPIRKQAYTFEFTVKSKFLKNKVKEIFIFVFFILWKFYASQSLDKAITMKREGKNKTFLFSSLVTPSFLQTQSTHKLQNKQKHKKSKACGLWIGPKNTFIKSKGQQEKQIHPWVITIGFTLPKFKETWTYLYFYLFIDLFKLSFYYWLTQMSVFFPTYTLWEICKQPHRLYK